MKYLLTAFTTIIAVGMFATASPVLAQETLFGVSHGPAGIIYTIDTTTAVPTPVGPHGLSNIQGLAFDSSGTLYGVDTVLDQLVTINTTTGAGTAVGLLGAANVRSIAFDSGGA